MKFENFAVSKRYAQAFLRAFYPQNESAPVGIYTRLVNFFKSHTGIIGLIAGCPCPHPCYNQLEEFLITKFELTTAEQKLIHRLLLDRKIVLLPSVFAHIITLEHERRNQIVCTIEFSHELSAESQQQAIQLFENITNKKIIPTVRVEPSLICGLRMYSATLMYERSLKRSLRAAQNLAKHKGGLW